MTTIKNSVAVVLAGVLAIGSFSVTRIRAADWPCFRGPNHNGISTEAISWPKGGPKPVWKINVGIGHSAVSVVGDRAYTMGNANDTDTVFSLDVATGKSTLVDQTTYTDPAAEKCSGSHVVSELGPSPTRVRHPSSLQRM